MGTTQNVVSGTIARLGQHRRSGRGRPGQPAGQTASTAAAAAACVINGGAALNTIGTTAAAEDVILGNKSYGVHITGVSTDYNVVEGDAIGSDKSSS